ncbi:MAG TPA: phytanoyl-CoA dioxygenase family protein [Candidatus Binatia bacterium]|jgi:ectoine hydroxylase-related dioxygenase (phytanoyl-CoA dioxygenase family)
MDTHVDADAVARDVAEMRAQGFVIIERLLAADDLARMRAALKPHLERELFGRNNFEGHRTERVYSLVGVAPLFADLVEHPRILAICDAFLEPNYLLTASQAIEIHPGETPQPLHTDDTFYRIPRPRSAVSVSTIYAIDDFTLENGATQIIPGSHTWSDDVVERLLAAADFTTAPRDARTPQMPAALPEGYSERLVDATMPTGSVIVFLGTLVHRGGANRSQRPRLALSNQYCEPWARQQENYTLSIPKESARALSPRVQELIGYSIHPPFMGHALGLHPRRFLERG